MSKRRNDNFDDFDDVDDFDEYDEDEFDEEYDGAPPINVSFTNVHELLDTLAREGATSALMDVVNSILAEPEPYEMPERPNQKVTMESSFGIDEPEPIPGTFREYLTSCKGTGCFSTLLCKWLTEDLKRFYERLLFGLIDDIYLHHSVTFTFSEGRFCIGTRVFWSDAKSPHRLLISNAADIVENPELTYLLVGDLVEDLMNEMEEEGRKKRRRDSRKRSYRKRRK